MTQPLAVRQIGQQSVFTATFTDSDGVLTDPAAVTFMWEVGTVETSFVFGTDPEVTQVSTGVYEFTAPVYATRTKHTVRVVSTDVAAADERVVNVSRSAFA